MHTDDGDPAHEGCERVSFYLPGKLKTEIKIMAILTKRTMSNFIRIALQDRIKLLKQGTNENKR